LPNRTFTIMQFIISRDGITVKVMVVYSSSWR